MNFTKTASAICLGAMALVGGYTDAQAAPSATVLRPVLQCAKHRPCRELVIRRLLELKNYVTEISGEVLQQLIEQFDRLSHGHKTDIENPGRLLDTLERHLVRSNRMTPEIRNEIKVLRSLLSCR